MMGFKTETWEWNPKFTFLTRLFSGKSTSVFAPLTNSNDLDALVRAMLGYRIERTQWEDGAYTVEVRKQFGFNEYGLEQWDIVSTIDAPTDRYATTFAIIDALVAEAERKEQENRDERFD